MHAMTDLNLGSNQIGDAVAAHTACMEAIKHLYLDSNLIGDTDAKQLSQMTKTIHLNLMLSERPGVAHLFRISGLINIGDTEMAHPSHMPNITTLDLSSNQIGDIGVTDITRMQTIRNLSLNHNHIGDWSSSHGSTIRNYSLRSEPQ